MDPAAIEAAITPRTRAIVIVHFGGYPADLDRICAIAEKHKLPLIEDCAHAQGTQWRGKGVGSYGEFGTFSFQQSKGLTCGEGGIILARTPEGQSACYRYHNLGRREDQGFYDFHTMSSNYRLTDLQGALLRTQFAKMKLQVPKKMEAAASLNKLLSEVDGLRPLPEDERITRQGFYFYLFRYDSKEFGGLSRDRFLEAMKAEGVPIGRTYGTPIHKYPLFQNWKWNGQNGGVDYSRVRCPVAERVLREQLCSIGHTTLLSSRSNLVKIAEAAMKIKEHVSELLEPRPVVTLLRGAEAGAAAAKTVA
jgi:dTDP-4-amino-4,6-dideoxygalactose transaminase